MERLRAFLSGLWTWLLVLLLTLAGMIYFLIRYLADVVDFYHRVRIMRLHTILLALVGTIFFASRYAIRVQAIPIPTPDYQSETVKDAQQDEHMGYNDRRIDELLKTQERVYLEGIDYTHLINSQIKDVGERVSHDEGIAFGLFAGIGILQTIGLLKQRRDK